MKKKTTSFYRLFLIFLVLFSLSSCNMPWSAAQIATMDVTQVYQTVEARLTQAATQAPAATPEPSPVSTITLLPSPTILPTTVTLAPPPATTTPLPTTACDLASPGSPIDVTIPDDSIMAPGQTYTKIWRLKNSGTCTWTRDYSIAVFSGEPMGAPASVPLPGVIAPGQSVDIGVDLTAPIQAGTYQGNWKLRNASKAWFGIGPGGTGAFWVRIIVEEQPTSTGAAPTEAATASPDIQASGSKTMVPGDGLNLDNNQINSGSGDDIAYSASENQQLLLTPSNGSIMGLYGGSEPGYEECLSFPMGSSPIILNNLSPGLYLCYQTNLGLSGWLLLKGFNPADLALTLQFLTWITP